MWARFPAQSRPGWERVGWLVVVGGGGNEEGRERERERKKGFLEKTSPGKKKKQKLERKKKLFSSHFLPLPRCTSPRGRSSCRSSRPKRAASRSGRASPRGRAPSTETCAAPRRMLVRTSTRTASPGCRRRAASSGGSSRRGGRRGLPRPAGGGRSGPRALQRGPRPGPWSGSEERVFFFFFFFFFFGKTRLSFFF